MASTQSLPALHFEPSIPPGLGEIATILGDPDGRCGHGQWRRQPDGPGLVERPVSEVPLPQKPCNHDKDHGQADQNVARFHGHCSLASWRTQFFTTILPNYGRP
jgi:hypothetical protein